jgi:hypothetical protein
VANRSPPPLEYGFMTHNKPWSEYFSILGYMHAVAPVVRVAYVDGAGREEGAVQSACVMCDVSKPVGWMDFAS